MHVDYARKWLVTLISGVSTSNDFSTFFWGTTKEATDWALTQLLEDENGDSPEFHGFQIAWKDAP